MTYMRSSFVSFSLSLLAAGLVSGCRTAQPKGAGALVVTPLYNPAARPIYLGIDGPHFFSHGGDAAVDFDLEEQQDGCARGAVNGNPIDVCPVASQSGQGDSTKTFRLNARRGL